MDKLLGGSLVVLCIIGIFFVTSSAPAPVEKPTLDYYESINATLWKYPEVRDFHQKYENVTFVKGFRASYGGIPIVDSFLYETVMWEQRGNETLHKVELAALLYENRTEFSIREYVTLN